MADRFDAAYDLRMCILGYLNKHGACSSRRLADSLDEDMDRVGRALRIMSEMAEIAAHGQGKSMIYSALTTISHSAQDRRNAMHHRRAETVKSLAEKDADKAAKVKAARDAKKLGNTTGRTLHIVTNKDKPIKNQGGQGAVTARRGCCSLESI